jgi:hypothetical protein
VDDTGTVLSGFLGTVHITSSDPRLAGLTYTFTAADAGTHTFSVTLKTAGGQTFTVQDTANATFASTQKDIAVTAAAVASFVLRAPSNVTAGVAFNLTLSAVDAFGNVVTDYTFTAADNGIHVFSVTFVSTGTQTIGVGDTVNGAIKGSTSVKVTTSTTSGGGGGGGGGRTA